MRTDRETVAAILCLCLAGSSASCRAKGPVDPPLAAKIRELRAFAAGLPRCSAPLKARAVDDIPANALLAPGDVVTVRGTLVGGGQFCTLMACESRCCNRCSGLWAVRGRSGRVVIAQRRDHDPAAQDCDVEASREALDGVDVTIVGERATNTASIGDIGADWPWLLQIHQLCRNQ